MSCVARVRRHQIQQHADAQNPEDDPEQNPHTDFLFTKSVKHGRKASRATRSAFSDIFRKTGRRRAYSENKLIIVDLSTYTQSLMLF